MRVLSCDRRLWQDYLNDKVHYQKGMSVANHPLQIFMTTLKASLPRSRHRLALERLAKQADLARPTLYRITNAKDRVSISPLKALKLELATNGAVPAESTCDTAAEVIDLVGKVMRQRARTAAPSTSDRE